MAFNNFPFLNLNTLNLDWLVKKINALESKVEELEKRVHDLEVNRNGD